LVVVELGVKKNGCRHRLDQVAQNLERTKVWSAIA
jgi:hypothetical protein